MQSTLEAILNAQLEEYIMQKTGSLEVFLKVLRNIPIGHVGVALQIVP